jgi:polysaccharide export outer membrane protein
MTIRAYLLFMLLSLPLAARAQNGPLVSTPPAQPPAQPQQPATNPAVLPVPTDSRYRIGPGDVLEIRVLKAPELSGTVRVDQQGLIQMPMIEGSIRAACLTENELAAELARRYLKYKRNPHVDVFVKEFQSQPVAVIGAVNQPGQFKLQRRVTLLELLTFAGGPAERAGQIVQVVHASGASICEQTEKDATEQASGEAGEAAALRNVVVTYRLKETLGGAPAANPFVRPGDIISVLEADQVYVIGNVLKPSAIPLKEPITVSKAIAMAGGTGQDTRKSKVRIFRQMPGSPTKQEIYVDLKAIEKRQAEDIALQANDIVDVPQSGTKSFMRSLLGTVAPAVSQLPVRVIP